MRKWKIRCLLSFLIGAGLVLIGVLTYVVPFKITVKVSFSSTLLSLVYFILSALWICYTYVMFRRKRALGDDLK